MSTLNDIVEIISMPNMIEATKITPTLKEYPNLNASVSKDASEITPDVDARGSNKSTNTMATLNDILEIITMNNQREFSKIITPDLEKTHNLTVSIQKDVTDMIVPNPKRNEVSISSAEEKVEKPKKKSKGHRCYFCGKKFMEKNVLRKHISIHKDKDFVCEICGKTFSAGWCLRKHKKIHTGERPFQCEYCGKTFIQKCTLQFHLKAIHGNNSNRQCRTCNKRLKTSAYNQCWLCRYEGREVNSNEEVAQVEKFNTCEVPTVEYVNLESNLPSDVSNTEVIYPMSNNYVCNVCQKTFSGPYELRQHLLEHSKPEILICKQCGSKFDSTLAMKEHLQTHTDLKPFVCLKCGKDFLKDINLKQHMMIHKQDRPFACRVCHRAFKSVPSLKQHFLTHSTDRPYSCKECQGRFKSPQALKNHVIVHNKEKPLTCKICSKGFTFLGNLQRHNRVHTGEKPYKCSICEKSFTQSNGLKAHELTHRKAENNLEHDCSYCKKKFKSFTNFKKHMLLH